MTFHATTITKTGAVISQDSLVYESDPAYRAHVANFVATRDYEGARNATYVGGGDPNTTIIVGHFLKIMPQPRFHMALAGTGNLRFMLGWSTGMMAIPSCDIVELHEATPAMLRELSRALHLEDNTVIIHAGYSPLRGSGCGFIYSKADNFEGLEMIVGETSAIPVDPQYERHAEIEALSHYASQGEKIKEFHAALMAQQLWSFNAGRMGPGAAIGGDMNTVVVGPDKIMIETAA